MITNYYNDHGNSTKELPQRGNVLLEIVSRREGLIICFMQSHWIFDAVQRDQIKIKHRLYSFLKLGIHYKMVVNRFATLRRISYQCSRPQIKTPRNLKIIVIHNFSNSIFFFYVIEHPCDRPFSEEKTDAQSI